MPKQRGRTPNGSNRRGRSAALLALALAATTGTTRAQPATPDAPSTPDVPRGDAPSSTGTEAPVVAPRLLTTTPVPYPETGAGSAAVVLELLVTAEGTVGEAHVVTGDAPFAPAALEAAREWRFVPATVGGAPRAARIRLEVTFTPSAAPIPEASWTSEAPALPAAPDLAPPPPPDTASIEVTVEGERRVVGQTSLGKVEIRELPGSFGDPFRAIEALPGVTPMLSGVPFFFIRGAPPGNQGYFFDGVRVPLLYHLGLGPGVIHPELVERVDLYPGGYPAQYGRFVGGIVAAESADPEPEPHGQAAVRLVDAGAYAHAPLAAGRGSATVAGRYSYTARMIELFAPDVRLQYWDYQVRTRWRATAHHALEAFWFGSFDLFRRDDPGGRYRLGTEFHRLDLRDDFELGRATEGRFALTLGVDRSREDNAHENGANLRDQLLAARVELKHRATPERLWRGGGDLTLVRHTLRWPEGQPALTEADVPDDLELHPSRTELATGAYGDVVLDVTPRVAIVAGGRVDLFAEREAARLGLDPRVAATFTVREGVRLVHALGIVHQPPSFVVPVPGISVTDLADGLQRGAQSSAGIEVDLPADVTAALTLFQHVVFNGTDILSVLTREDLLEAASDDVSLRSLGHTYGAELLVRRTGEHRVGGFLAYTLSRSERSFLAFHGASSFDRTHVLNAALSYDLGKRWRAGTRVVVYSGVPFEVWGNYVGTAPSADAEPQLSEDYTRFVVRTAPFYRLDWRLEKRWVYGRHGGWWAFTAEVLNTTLHKEEVLPACPDGACSAERIGPVTVPALGVEAAL